jgi:hypothetical protein
MQKDVNVAIIVEIFTCIKVRKASFMACTDVGRYLPLSGYLEIII